MSKKTAQRVWLFYLLLGGLSASGYLLIPSLGTRNLVYDVINNVVGLSAVAAVVIGVRIHRPVRTLPWYLLAIGLLVFAAGDLIVTVYEVILRTRVPSPSLIDVFYLAFYPITIIGLLMLQSSRLSRSGLVNLIDPLIVATGASLPFWIGLMRPYLIEPFIQRMDIPVLPVLIAVAYPLMDLLLFVVLIRMLLLSKGRSPAYRLLGAGLGILLLADVAWTVAQALGSYRLGSPIDAAFLLFFLPFGAAALHPSMSDLFEPVPRVEVKLTRPRLALLAGASLMAPSALALQALLGQPINVPLIVMSSALLFLLVVARMLGMLRAQERSAERERILRQAGTVLAAASGSKELYKSSLSAVLDLLQKSSGVQANLWLGSITDMKRVATTSKREEDSLHGTADLGQLPEGVQSSLQEGQFVTVHSTSVATLQKLSGQRTSTGESLIVPLRTRAEFTGALVVTSDIPLAQESKNALQVLGAEIALAAENLLLIEEAKKMSVLEERQRLAHEIHDTLAQGFTSISMSISAAQLAEPHKFSGSTPACRHLNSARRVASESLAESRRLVWALRPESLDRHTLPEALANLVEEWSRETGIKAQSDTTGTPCDLLPETEVALLRIAQEGLANIRKYAGASRAMLTLSYMDDLVVLDIADDGVGFDHAAPSRKIDPQDVGGFGLVAIRERAEQLGGQFLIESSSGRGTTLAIELPATPRATHPTRDARRYEHETSRETR